MATATQIFTIANPVALEARHLDELRDSAIGDDVIAARGYRSVSDPIELPPEFQGEQRTLTGLLIPVRDVTGKVALHQLKPDAPRKDRRGKPLKYEWPAGFGPRLDVPQTSLPHLRDTSVPLWITEGVKKVDSAVSHGIHAIIGLPGVWSWMSKGVALPDWREIALDGREVVIAFDSDVMTKDTVREALECLASYLQMRGAHVRYCLMPSLPSGEKCGLDDWFAMGNSLSALSQTIVDVLSDPVHGWEDPLPIPTLQGPSFPRGVFPEIVEQYVDAMAEETQTPRDLPALVALGALSAAAGGKFIIQPYPERKWEEPAHLHVVAVAESGMRKSSVFGRMTAPIFAVERERQEAAKPAIAEWESRERALSNALKSAEQAKSAKGGANITNDEAIRMAAAQELAEHREKRPWMPRLVLDDATPEVAVQHMSQQGGTIAVMSAEASFLSNIAGQYSERPKFDVLLKGYSGESLQTDRIGRESEHISRACLTLCLSVQPSVIADLGKVHGFEDRGGIARLLAGYVPDHRGFENLDAAPVPSCLEERWERLLRTLLNTTLPSSDGEGVTFHVLNLAPDARRDFRRMEEIHLGLMRPGGAFREIDKWGARFPAQVLRIAALLHIAARDKPQASLIDADTLRRAIQIGEYFAGHAFLLHRHVRGRGGYTDALDILEEMRDLGPIVSKRDLHRRVRGRVRFEKADSLDAPLHILEELQWIRKLRSPGNKPGRPSEVYEVNPATYMDKMDKTWIPDLSVHFVHALGVERDDALAAPDSAVGTTNARHRLHGMTPRAELEVRAD